MYSQKKLARYDWSALDTDDDSDYPQSLDDVDLPEDDAVDENEADDADGIESVE